VSLKTGKTRIKIRRTKTSLRTKMSITSPVSAGQIWLAIALETTMRKWTNTTNGCLKSRKEKILAMTKDVIDKITIIKAVIISLITETKKVAIKIKGDNKNSKTNNMKTTIIKVVIISIKATGARRDRIGLKDKKGIKMVTKKTKAKSSKITQKSKNLILTISKKKMSLIINSRTDTRKTIMIKTMVATKSIRVINTPNRGITRTISLITTNTSNSSFILTKTTMQTKTNIWIIGK
jgi:hypothetical protein